MQRRMHWTVVTTPVLVLVLGLAGCGSSTGTQTPSDPGASLGPTSGVVASVEPDATAQPPEATAQPPEATAQPPEAAIAVEGGEPVVAQLGTYTWGETGSDSPWLPGAPVAVGAGESLGVAFDPAVAIADWTSRYVPSSATSPVGAVILGNGADRAMFTTPPVGSWTVEVRVVFAGGVGEASYFWQVEVD